MSAIDLCEHLEKFDDKERGDRVCRDCGLVLQRLFSTESFTNFPRVRRG
ncbi:unnamed protein product [marine sediment metagenome]|uniref:TFIIB-type domain-containing protein n=1 Tax=marine sediment metagenome TaxID=412755 RepID=X1CSJ4_9ZZZZ